MDILKEYASTELNIKNSRFLAEVIPVKSQSEARSVLKSQKEKYKDASHVVHGFVLGTKGEILGMSDDGEPSGTGGRPVLDVVKGRHCTNILLTVTRWFGGTLLGTGGLVKAYGDSAKAVLDLAVFEPLIEKSPFNFSLPYDMYDQVKRFFTQYDITDVQETFDTEIHISGLIPTINREELNNYMVNLTKGRIEDI